MRLRMERQVVVINGYIKINKNKHMNITPSEKRQSTGNEKKYIGYFNGPLRWVNPDANTLKEIYAEEGEIEEPKYQGVDKNEKDWSMLRFVFQEDISKIPVEYKIFLSKDIAEFEKDGVTKTWYINQHGQSQCVADKKDLFRSITHLQKWNKDEGKMEDVLNENREPIELQWRKAHKGETALYSLLRKLVTQNWFEATEEANLFIKIDAIMRGKVSDITTWIGTENYQSVVGMIEIQAKDGENGINYFQNCVDSAWMPGWKIKEANITTASNSWNKYDEKANGKGKNKEMYEFYQAVKRNKHITEFHYIHEFSPDSHIAAGNSAIQHTDNQSAGDTDY